jgi:hypothetical protein
MLTPANATANAVAYPSTLQARQADLARNFPALKGNAASSSNVDPDAQKWRDILEYQRLEAERERAAAERDRVAAEREERIRREEAEREERIRGEEAEREGVTFLRELLSQQMQVNSPF